jgi:RNA polymerase sigma-70 factor (ECF subfamily)
MPNQNAYTMSPSKASADNTPRGQSISIEHLVRDYYPYIRRLALSILDDSHEADDAAQDTFIAANHALSGFRAEAHIKTWLSAIAINVCRGRLRKRKVRLALQKSLNTLHILSNTPISIESITAGREADRQLWQAVDGLDDKHRFPVLLRYVHQMSIPEIAEVLKLNEGTVYSRLHYARFKLQARLGHLNSREEVSDDASIPR